MTHSQCRLATLYDTHHERVFRFCLRLCNGQREEAEDLTQEVFVAALGSLPRFVGRSSVQTWLFRIAVFRSRAFRSRLRERSFREESDLLTAGAADHLELIALQCAIATLPEALREAFVLVKCEQLTHKEAAAVLKRPQGTVQAQVFEAVHRLQAQLQDSEEVRS